jgi:hypothetical protein
MKAAAFKIYFQELAFKKVPPGMASNSSKENSSVGDDSSATIDISSASLKISALQLLLSIV